MIKEILTTAVSVAVGIILAKVISEKLLKMSSWDDDEDGWEED